MADRALVAVTKRVIESGGVTLVDDTCDGLPQTALKVAVIGFAGDAMRGMLAVSADAPLLARTCPVGENHDDWLCELSNLLLGRFKADLLRLGISVHLSTPMLIEGTIVSLDTHSVAPIVHRFRSDDGNYMYVLLDAVAEPATRVSENEVDVAAAGSVFMFDGGDHA